ncbi:MAG: hypothetical protein MK212_19900, partial [Saprospiraceae bacterium]|nr:hypothetical protein [Saprospiraceae bacterium]
TYSLKYTQKEAIDFVSNDLLYLSDEKSILGSARLYSYLLEREHRKESFYKLKVKGLRLRQPKIGDRKIELFFEVNRKRKITYRVECISTFYSKKVSVKTTKFGENKLKLPLPKTMQQNASFLYKIVLRPIGEKPITIGFQFEKELEFQRDNQ